MITHICSHTYVDNGIYDAGILEDYPTEAYTPNDLPLPKVQFPSDTTRAKGMWFESNLME